MKLFSYESRFSQLLLNLCYSCWLNILWFICSLPIVTAGAATTALYYVCFKVVKGEEGNVTAMFFRSFRENFRQATGLWLVMLGAGIFLGGDIYILYHLRRAASGPAAIFWTMVMALVIAAAVMYTIVLIYIFPLTASVVNTGRELLKNSFLIGTHYLFATILVFAVHFAMAFAVISIFTPLIIFGEGLCAMISAYLLGGVIEACSFHPEEQEETEESEGIGQQEP